MMWRSHYCWSFLLTIWILSIGLNGLAQQPSYYIIGEDELEGEHIYDIHQSSSGDYWITTNSGLIRFNGYTFERQSCIDILTPSLFDLTEDLEENLYCFNLAGQIFKVSQKGCEPFYTLPDSLLAAELDIEVDDQGNLVVMSAGVVVVDQNGEEKHLPSVGVPGSSYLGYLTKMPDGSLWGSPTADGRTFIWKDNQLGSFRIPSITRLGFSPMHYKVFQNQKLLVQTGTAKLFRLINDSIDTLTIDGLPNSDQRTAIHQTKDHLWLLGGTTGALRLNSDLEVEDKHGSIFPNTFISTVFQDSERNILLGTFGSGIIVIPDGAASDLTSLPAEEKAVSITSGPDGTLYFGTQTGNVFKHGPNGSTLLRPGQKRSIEHLFHLSDNSLLFTDIEGVKFDLNQNDEQEIIVGSVKDVFRSRSGDHLIASNQGGLILRSGSKRGDKIPELNVRLHGIGEDPSTGTIYGCSSKGLMLLKKGNLETIELDGKPVIARDIAASENTVFAATNNSGIVVFQNDSIIDVWDVNDGLISDRVRKIECVNDRIYAATDQGIQILSTKGDLIRSITRSEGLYAENIRQFEVVGNTLWVVHNRGVQYIPLEQNSIFKFQPELTLDNLEVNDSVYTLASNRFSSGQNRFRFELRSNTLRFQNEVKYHFKLIGADENWQINDFKGNIIEYRSLAPGKYRFQAKAVCSGAESPIFEYPFTISAPFYQTWWFLLLTAAAIIFIVSLIFQRRLRIQQARARQVNELNASKLTAIQSQMNPHFIFNALNSIQDLVLKGDIDNSYTFITKFANLVRRTLNYSDKEFIAFEEELELIELYLTLEKLRFRTNFSYHIDHDDVEGIRIPPMLIQPFIENALVHGLLHKEGDKKVEISFSLGEVLTCQIKDNGIGRQRSKEIQKRMKREHESFSVAAIRKRFEILETHLGGTLGFEYSDNSDGGTTVTLRIPVVRSF